MLFFSYVAQSQAASEEYFPQLFIRSSAGVIKNEGTTPGSATTFGGGNIGGLYFFNSRLALGGAYKAEFTRLNIPLKGIDIILRYYFWNLGTKIKSVNSAGDVIIKQEPWSLYLGADYAMRDYYARKTSFTALTGTTSAANVELGMDLKLYQDFGMNFELNTTVLAFTSSDPRVRISWVLFNSGFIYTW